MPKHIDSKSLSGFQRRVRSFYKKNGRHSLPWRKTRSPYKILVSEIMLQQTQAHRVIPKYKAFLKRFPSPGVLAAAPLGDVLREWQGLGYNRRAKMLHDAMRAVVANHKGKIPRSYAELIALPGIGMYTARAVRVFTWNEPDILIETNIRTAFIHHFFPKGNRVSDKKLFPYMEITLDRKHPREWHAALMDYGSHLKKTVPNPSRKSAHYGTQKPFKGSDREIRGAILRELAKSNQKISSLVTVLPFSKKRIQSQLARLSKEGLAVVKRGSAYLP